ncbi:MAG: S1C family serine protease [Treponema sp.]|nr:S1C family serine protease [Treponema sp.]
MRAPVVFFSLVAALALSCQTGQSVGNARRSTVEIRIDEILAQIDEDPVRAIDLIHSYREIYRVGAGYEREAALLEMEEEATRNLRGLLELAMEEERWDDAASLARSLSNVEQSGFSQWEARFALAHALASLEKGDNLSAFISGARAHQLAPLSAENALRFLRRAVEGRQRGTAAFFHAALNRAGGSAPADLREYALGSDSPADMLKGVATVIVDRGFRSDRGRMVQDRSLGSAFFVDSSGLLITNYHVIESEVDPSFRGNSRLFIRMGDATSPRIPARVVGWDKTQDLALISAPARSEFAFSVIDRKVPAIGETVIAMGSPLGLEQTVTSGIVSSLSRGFFLQVGEAMQIDAAVNPGNSGGPLVDSSGRLVGVVFAGSPQFSGLNFVIPAERLLAALPALIRGGRAARPWFGSVVGETFSGAEIIYAAPNSPLARHRVPEGSVIVSVNGREVRAPQGQLVSATQDTIFATRPGELVALETLEADGQVRRRLIMTVERPDLPLLGAVQTDSRDRLATPFFGMSLSHVGGSGRLARFSVERVMRGFFADNAGISVQDTLTIRSMRVIEDFIVMELNVRKRNMGFMDVSMQFAVFLDSPDTF